MFFAVIIIMTLFFINSSFAANTARINVETANLRETANTDSRILKQLPKKSRSRNNRKKWRLV